MVASPEKEPQPDEVLDASLAKPEWVVEERTYKCLQ